jgi:hypothetical protein
VGNTAVVRSADTEGVGVTVASGAADVAVGAGVADGVDVDVGGELLHAAKTNASAPNLSNANRLFMAVTLPLVQLLRTLEAIGGTL